MNWTIDYEPVAVMANKIRRALLDFANGVIAVTLGPMAPTRKRPRRIARKLASRRGRLHYPLRFR